MFEKISPAEIGKIWESEYGELTQELRIDFLKHPAIERIQKFTKPKIVIAIQEKKRLVEIADYLENFNRATNFEDATWVKDRDARGHIFWKHFDLD